MKGGNGRGHRRGRVALNQHPVRSDVAQERIEHAEQAPGHDGRRLIRLHHLEVDIRPDAEQIEGLVYQVTMLPCGADDGLKATTIRRESPDDRRHLDDVWSGADDDKDFHA